MELLNFNKFLGSEKKDAKKTPKKQRKKIAKSKIFL